MMVLICTEIKANKKLNHNNKDMLLLLFKTIIAMLTQKKNSHALIHLEIHLEKNK